MDLEIQSKVAVKVKNADLEARMTTATSDFAELSKHSLQTLASLLHSGDKPLPPPQFAEQRLLLISMNELDGVSRLVAVTGSIANALAANASQAPARTNLSAFLPAVLKTVPALQTLPDLPVATVSAIQALDAGLDALKKMTTAFANGYGEAGRAGLNIETIADGWRRLASLAITVREDLSEIAFPETLDAMRPFAKGIDRMLSATAAGLSPCVADDGQIEIPGLAERRRSPRFATGWRIKVIHNGKACDAILADLSAGGAGLNGLTNCRLGDSLELKLSADRKLNAVVKWVSRDRCGAGFIVRLTEDDPLLIKARDAARSSRIMLSKSLITP